MDYKELIIKPLSDDSPCGANLEDDAGFQNFFFAAQGTPERFDGENTVDAEPPDWRQIQKQSLEFMQQSKDAKLICILAQAVLNTEGIQAFSACLQGLAELFNNQWAHLYPLLDEDDGDPLERVAALAHLNEVFITNTLKSLPLASARGIGQVTLTAINQINDASNDSALNETQIKGIFTENNFDQLQLLHTEVTYCLSSLSAINDCLTENAGHQYAADFSKVSELLEQILAALDKFADLAPQETEQTASVEESEDANVLETGAENQGANVQRADGNKVQQSSYATSGRVSSREDVERCLGMVNDYYAQHEPSSPIPVLINRALKLVNKDFLEIMKDIYPDALPALQQLGGLSEEERQGSSDSDDSW